MILFTGFTWTQPLEVNCRIDAGIFGWVVFLSRIFEGYASYMKDGYLDLMAMAGLRDELEALRTDAQSGNPIAQFNMGVRYAQGQGVDQDYIEAARWYAAAADQGDVPAQFNLGLLFYEGKGVERNITTAFELFRLAALQGDERARAGLDAVLQSLDAQSQQSLLQRFPLPLTH